ncbi:AbrB/MazE/SpoVT family DNA-binding domain-containing protein [Candidatus Woesearchaeota archaeon]|nr:AbrB/MazE/SpoVT family DNA-binding domain-containing protein [Candidatus Woesearchaeota archaeon]
MTTEAIVRKWGNSMGVILPKDLVEKEHLQENDKILFEVVKEADLTRLFGSLPRKLSGQKFKDLVRRGWN